MNKLAHYSEDGKLLGFYDKQIHVNLPLNCVEITEELWQDILLNPNKWIFDPKNKTFTLSPEPSEEEKKQIDINKKIEDIQNKIRALIRQLSETDWMAHQEVEENVSMPSDIKQQRIDIRKQIKSYQQEISKITRVSKIAKN